MITGGLYFSISKSAGGKFWFLPLESVPLSILFACLCVCISHPLPQPETASWACDLCSLTESQAWFTALLSLPEFLNKESCIYILHWALQIMEKAMAPPLQYSCLENPMDGGAWKAAVHGVAESQIRLSVFAFTFHVHALEKEMATHSSVLAWRIPGTGEPGGLPSVGSHRVGHD